MASHLIGPDGTKKESLNTDCGPVVNYGCSLEMHSSHWLDTIWEEVSFTLKPRVDLNAVAEAFIKFYEDYNRIGRPRIEFHTFVSDGSVMLHAESGGDTYDAVDMYLTESSTGEFIARFCAGGTYPKWGNHGFTQGYEQIRRFFNELSKDLLEVRNWGERAEAGNEKQNLRVCRFCGTPVRRPDANFCWKCGAKMTLEESHSGVPATAVATSSRASQEQSLRMCIVCQLSFMQGDLLAWCPFCLGAAHRAHLLEYLHVHGKCPSCGHQLEEKDLAHQFEEAWLKLPNIDHE